MADLKIHFSILLLQFCVLLIFQMDLANAKTLPSFIMPCKRNDVQLGSCLQRTVEKLRPHLKTGIPDLQLPPYDPLFLPLVTLSEQSPGKAVRFTATFTDLYAYGAHKSLLKQISVDLKKPSLRTRIVFPKLRIVANYVIDGQVLIVPIRGEGKANCNLTNVDADIVMNGRYLQKMKKQHFNVQESNVTLSIGGAQLYFGNLFNGNKELGDATNVFINKNWKEIIDEIKPVIEDSVASLVKSFISPIFDNFSIDQLLTT
ncbi:protein takeout-like [Nilaparvata lugens]|uniref:protein takeout-like n=1 Tax=Nilaparvata lugens TaxID=108931 RepID=UPI00193D1F5A|nr:protein takeout-like [Nilaparvata lugens]